ncbi:MAG: TIGR00730 family Rossman fold protein [Patescibacteria group bacterium]|jgi:hypothetical protein
MKKDKIRDIIAQSHRGKQEELAQLRGEIIKPKDIAEKAGWITWRILRIMAEFTDGYDFLGKLEQDVTVFGSARTKPGSRYYEEAYKLGRLLGQHKYTVVTGGGPGIMEAANKGAFEVGAKSLGLNIKLPMEQRLNPYVTGSIGFHFFFTRKVMLTSPSAAFAFFPGGFGTMDEFFEVVTLIQTRKMDRVPCVLVGKEFWSPLNHFIKYGMLDNEHTINKEDMNLYTIVDTAEEAYSFIKKYKIKRTF